jgi:predicted RNA-binding Zn-ribbon protein involved in translation (DUF1610 family)
METKRAAPTKEEADILYEAQKDFMANGYTNITCPRCGNKLEYRMRGSSTSYTCCATEDCIAVYTRGI